MKKLWIFGDSFSQEFYNNKTKTADWQEPYVNWKGYIPVSFSEILSTKLKSNCINKSIAAADNYTIFESIIECIDMIQTDDIIIIGWSSPLRYRIVNKKNKFISLTTWWHSANQHALNTISISQTTINDIFLNRNQNITLYINEINNFIKIINKAFPENKIIHWTPFNSSIENGLNVLNIPIIQTIEEETNNTITDAHFSETGHNILADYFYSIICKNDKLI